MPELSSAWGTLQLLRYPRRRQEALLPWCGADILLLEQVAQGHPETANALVVNDEHGVLSTALQPQATWTDSALAARAMQENCERNGRPPPQLVWSTQAPPEATSLVVMRIPKQLAYFRHQLSLLAGRLPPGTPLLAAGMDKHLSPHIAELMEQHVGPTTRHRGQRKARVFSAVFGGPRAPAPEVPGYHCSEAGGTLSGGANVFSSDRLDPGSALLLDNLGRLAPVARAADLACGNGVIGLAALRGGVCGHCVFADESAMAIAAVQHNAEALGREATAVTALHGDGLLDYPGPPLELVLCNPPFHQQHAVDDFAGRRLLRQAARHLVETGQLCVVANRHLPYQNLLSRRFQRVEKIAADRRFSLWLASGPLRA